MWSSSITTATGSIVNAVFDYLTPSRWRRPPQQPQTITEQAVVAVANPPPAPASTTSRVTSTLGNQTAKKKAWYALSSDQKMYLTSQVIGDIIWVILWTKGVNYRFEVTDDVWSQNAAQQLWIAIGLLVTTPLNAGIWSFLLKENYINSLINALISSIILSLRVTPWNGFAYLGQMLFTSLGCSAKAATYLAALFPGTGTAEAFTTTLGGAFLSHLFAPNSKFNLTTFLLNLSPLNYISGDLWLIIFNALADVAVKSTGGLVGQTAAVALGVAFAEYLTMISLNAISDKCKEKFACCAKDYNGLNLFQRKKDNEDRTQQPVTYTYTTESRYIP